MSSSRGSSRLRDQTHVSQVPCIDRWILYHLRHVGSPEYLYTTIFEDFCITRRRYYLFPGQRACLSAVLLCPQSNDEANFLAAPYCKIGRVPHLRTILCGPSVHLGLPPAWWGLGTRRHEAHAAKNAMSNQVRGLQSRSLGASQVVLVVKKPPANAGGIRNVGLNPWSGRSPGGGCGTQASILAWRIHGQRSLAGYGPWGHKELDMTEVT